MANSKIVVVGSSNTDMVVRSSKIPAPGETVLGGDFIMTPGGKGANQAVAAAKLGGDTTFVAQVGNDMFGEAAIQGFQQVGIHTAFVQIDGQNPSGVALIMVDGQGENCISVALGANAAMDNALIDAAQTAISEADYVLVQLEIPIGVVAYLIESAQREGTPVVLNPAPAQALPDEMLRALHIITPNETEAEILTGIKVYDQGTARQAAQLLRDKGVGTVIITLGAKGAYVLSDQLDETVPSLKVQAVDTTAAGDTFNGALVVALAEGMGLKEAVVFANKAAAASVTKMGAQASIPFRKDIGSET